MTDDPEKPNIVSKPLEENDRTVIAPTPGRRAAPQQAVPFPALATMPAGLSESMELKYGLNPLMASASELVVLLGELRHTVKVQNPNQLRAQVVAAIRQFESKAGNRGAPPDVTLSARYILCACLDEAILNTPWGSEAGWASASLLSTFHNETFGGEKVFLILDRIQSTPAKYIDLIELIYVCLSLGFEGKYQLDPRGRDQLEIIRDNLCRTIEVQRGSSDQQLSPRWQGASQSGRKIMEYVPLWVIAAIVVAVMLVSYTGYRVWLEEVTDPLEQELIELKDKYQP